MDPGQVSKDEDGRLGPLVRYGVVGAGQNLIAYAVTLALLATGLQPWMATAIVYPAAALASFVGNKFWSFQKRPSNRGQFLRFMFAYVGVYPLSIGITWSLGRLGIDPRLATLGSILGSAIVLFLILTKWVFPESKYSKRGS